MTTIREAVRAQLDAVSAISADRAYAARQLAELPNSDIPAALERDPRLRTIGGLDAVLNRADGEVDRDVTVVAQLCASVLALVERLPADDAALFIRGRALRLQAYGLREAGALRQARALLAEAQAVLATTPAGAIEREHARLLDAYILDEMGEHDQALALVKKAEVGYAALNAEKGRAQALLAAAGIHFSAGAYALAQTLYETALPVARATGDARGEAVALGNLGTCAMRLGHSRRALAYFAEALPLLGRLEMAMNRQAVFWAMAHLAVQEGRLVDAFRRFASVREDFLRRGMFLSAAYVALEFAEFLVQTGRGKAARQWCRDLVQTFSAAGMPEYALRALVQLKDAADNSALDEQVLGRVRADVRAHLQAYA
jgi:tetratricopeptide (TPR) repeat protein